MTGDDTRGGWDVHCHLIPATVVEAAHRGEFGLEVTDGALGGRAFRAPLGRIADPAALAAWVEANRLDGAIPAPPPPLFRPDLSGDERRRWVALVNEGMLQAADGASLRPMAYVPAEDPAEAAATVTSLDPAFAGVTVGTDLAGRSYADPGYDRLWAALVERRLPVFLHPGEPRDDRLDAFYLGNLLGNPYETTVAVAQIVFGGVLDRFPDLVLVLAHGGGMVPSAIGRWEHAHSIGRPGVPRLERSPIEALRMMYLDTIVHSPIALAALAALVGADHVLFGSDWPFPMGVGASRPIPGADPDLEKRILVDNPGAVFPAP